MADELKTDDGLEAAGQPMEGFSRIGDLQEKLDAAKAALDRVSEAARHIEPCMNGILKEHGEQQSETYTVGIAMALSLNAELVHARELICEASAAAHSVPKSFSDMLDAMAEMRKELLAAQERNAELSSRVRDIDVKIQELLETD